MNAAILIDFLRRLVKDCECKVILILDNLHFNYAKKIKD
jgi:hypothetical protein